MDATQYVAFLRAVNVGGRVVKMAELKKVFEVAGLDDVSTFIASGNVIFTSAKTAHTLVPQMETALQSALSYRVATILRTALEVAAIAAHEPFARESSSQGSLFVGLMQEPPPAAAARRIQALQTDVDSLRVVGREVYWLARNNFAGATISSAALEKALQTPATFRNMNTIRRLAARLSIGS